MADLRGGRCADLAGSMGASPERRQPVGSGQCRSLDIHTYVGPAGMMMMMTMTMMVINRDDGDDDDGDDDDDDND